MFDEQLLDRLGSFIIFIPFFLISLSIHEYAHAYFAHKYGDNTAKDQGRLTLNPLKHLDLLGSVLLPIFAFISGFAIIGWAKPVPVDRRNFSKPLEQDAIVSFAGPLSNFLLSIVFLLIFALIYHGGLFPAETANFILRIVGFGIYLNIFLFAFNLLPIPPLDGSHILFDLFPNKYTAKLLQFGFYGTFILLLFIYSPLWDYFAQLMSSIIDFYFQLAGVG